MKNNELKQFKYNFLNLRWLIVIAAGYMAVFSATNYGFRAVNYINALVLFFILSNVFLYFVSLDLFKNRYFRYFIFIADIVLVSLAIYYTKSAGTDFFLLYFLVIVITALGKDVKASIVATVVASLLYFWLILNKDTSVYDVNMYMRIPFLFVVGLFTGFLSETVKKEEEHVKGLRLILSITNIINENMDYAVMVKYLDPFFEKIDTIVDWEIGVLNESTGKFSLLCEGSDVAVADMDPVMVQALINKREIYKGKKYVYFPQAREKKVTGFLRIKPKNYNALTELDYDLFMTLSSELGIVIERNKLFEQIRNMANTDRLTELYNYRYFLEQVDKKYDDKTSFAVIMIDLDNFKKYNDNYGHQAGNLCLKYIADNLKKELRSCLLARYGGDEFVVLRDGKNEDIAAFLKEFKAGMDAKLLEFEKNIQVSMSIGYALFPKDGKTTQEVLAMADKALYKAKEAGKNRISYL